MPTLRQPAVVAILALSLVVVLAHLPYVTQPPDDLDSLNFALGVRTYDVARHQPHPPGAPVYIALGRATLWMLQPLGLAADPLAGLESVALAVLAAISAGVMLVAVWRLFSALGLAEPAACVGALLCVACPLTWLLSARPLSDVPGLALATMAQAALLGHSRRGIFIGAIAAGLSAGIRIQAAVLTLPLLVVRILHEWRRNRREASLQASIAWVLTVAGWSAVLLFHAGQPTTYAQAAATQAREDFTSGMLVWSVSSGREILRAIRWTLVFPWGTTPLAALMLVLAAVGTVVAFRERRWREWGILSLLWVPYTAFHFLAQEPWTVRYALPLVVPAAYLAARAIAAFPPRGRTIAAAIALLATVGTSVRALAVDSTARSPLYMLAHDMTAEARREHERPIVLAHFGAGIALRRVEQVVDGRAAWQTVRTRRSREWLQIAEIWTNNPAGRVWFVAHPRRTDLALVDPSSRRLLRAYRHPEEVRWIVAGSRPSALNWYEITRPNWIALEGWALTPETAGVATRDRRGPDVRPITALVRPLDEPTTVLVGGRYLGAPDGAPARITILRDGREVEAFEVGPSPRDFVRLMSWPPSPSPSRHYSHLTIAAALPDASPAPVAIEQFDYQPARSAVLGLGRGWHEQELDPRRGLLWRWTASEAELHLRATGDVRLEISGESPRRSFPGPARLTVRAGATVLAERRLDGDYRETFCVPASAVKGADGKITLATDRTFTPSHNGRSADQRVLGLRVFDLSVQAGCPN